MNRRGHMSAKVPNVKLRPNTRRHAAPLSLDEDIVQRAWDEAEYELDESEISMSSGSKPWAGITITFTGVDEKSALVKLVAALGGKTESALTVNVTHVVAPGFGSPKYLYAIEHGLPVLSPAWIQDAHDRWMKGETLDVPGSIEAFRLAPFLGLKIAISGIDDIARRRQMIRLINDNGGVYSKDLDRSCTHLISAWSSEDKSHKSEKVIWLVGELGNREAGRRRGTRYDTDDPQIVYDEWLWDCVAFRGRWPEIHYDARKPRALGRVTPEEVLDGSVFERLRPRSSPPPQDDQPVIVRKRKRETMDTLVGELLSTANVEAEIKVEVVDVDAQEHGQDVTTDELPSRGDAFERKPSVLHASRSDSFAKISAAGPSRSDSFAIPNADGSTSVPRAPRKKIYAGLRFAYAIPQGAKPLENAILGLGATLIREPERLAGEPVDYLVIRLGAPVPPPVPDVAQPVVVTECWVEACAFEKEVLPPDNHIVFRPLSFPTPLPGADAITVHVTGFGTDSSVFLRRLLKGVGMNVEKMMVRNVTTHLVMAAPTGTKFEKAKEWGVAVVGESWVWALKDGRIDDVAKHSLMGTAADDTTPKAKTPTARYRSSLDVPTPDLTRKSRSETPNAPAPFSPKERVLNRATTSPNGSATPAASPPKATVSSHDDVTAQLRRLAEGDAAPRSTVPLRRSRPSRPTPTTSLSGIGSTSTTGSTSNSPVAALAALAEHHPAPPQGVEDESMRVTYADPASEKEKRKLLAAVLRGAGAGEKRARI